MKLPLLIAHRGASRYAPENTIAAFQKARDLGASWVETDVRLTKDFIPVLHHDDSLLRTTGVDALVNEYTITQIEQCDAGSFFSPEFKDERIPRLTDLLTFLADNHMGLNLELKPAVGMETDTAVIAMQTVIEAGFPAEDMLISSFSMLALEAAYAHAPQYHYGWLCDDERSLDIGLASPIPFDTIHLNQAWASQLLIETLKSRGYQVLCFTVNDQARAAALLAMGVAGVFSDEPSLFSK